jgi:hypothetical protein
VVAATAEKDVGQGAGVAASAPAPTGPAFQLAATAQSLTSWMPTLSM